MIHILTNFWKYLNFLKIVFHEMFGRGKENRMIFDPLVSHTTV